MERRPLPFKELRPVDLLEQDPTVFGLDPLIGELPRPPEELSALFLNFSVSDEVPLQIEGLLRVALGTASYGLFFSPIYDVAFGLLLRAGDAAVAMKAEQEGAPNSVTSLKRRIDWLHSAGLIVAEENAFWEELRDLRNQATHLIFPLQFIAPGIVLYQAISVVHAINALFDRSVEFELFEELSHRTLAIKNKQPRNRPS